MAADCCVGREAVEALLHWTSALNDDTNTVHSSRRLCVCVCECVCVSV